MSPLITEVLDLMTFKRSFSNYSVILYHSKNTYFSVYRMVNNVLVLKEMLSWNFHVFIKLSFDDCYKIFTSASRFCSDEEWKLNISLRRENDMPWKESYKDKYNIR